MACRYGGTAGPWGAVGTQGRSAEPPVSPHTHTQRTTYVWREPRLCRGGQRLPPPRVRGCRSADFWLKVGVSVGTCVAVLLAALAAYFWKKNQK